MKRDKLKAVEFADSGNVHNWSELITLLPNIVNEKNLIGNNKSEKLYNIPCAFDIETSSFYRDVNGVTYDYSAAVEFQKKHGVKLEKIAVMYIWQFGINGTCFVGREWSEFEEMITALCSALQLSEKKRLIVYVHNLSYEFQFLQKHFQWQKVFATDLRKPLYCITVNGIEFRCSYLLSGYSLAKLSKQLQTYKVAKLVGELDYSKIRHTKTPMTTSEIAYCVNDIRVVMCYIKERIMEFKSIARIPLTKTGIVRKYCRAKTLRTTTENGAVMPNWTYRELMCDLTISGMDEFNALQRAFQGGFTHCNSYYSGDVVENVASYDFTSSYPYVMISEQYPMSCGVAVRVKSKAQFDYFISKYLCIFDVEFSDIFASRTNENPISVSKCYLRENIAENNGRLVAARKIATTITNIDYSVIKNFYTWSDMRIGQMWVYKKQYLPTEFVESILQLYKKKTELKGVKGMESEYLNSKEMLNSCYGMSVTNPLRDEFTYNGVWNESELTEPMKIETLQKYNTSKNRFLYYPWGVFVTAYARRNLFTAIAECGNDYIYSDTDSVKITNHTAHKLYFDAYNNLVYNKLQRACKYHNLPIELCAPKTIKGITKLLGVWDFEGEYRRFKSLGAKRYMVECHNALTVGNRDFDFSLTVSGVNKSDAIPYMLDKYGAENIFDAFDNYLTIPETASGKKLHTYIDYETNGTVRDYNGVLSEFRELTAVHLEPTSYTLSLAIMYINYLIGIKLKEK